MKFVVTCPAQRDGGVQCHVLLTLLKITPIHIIFSPPPPETLNFSVHQGGGLDTDTDTGADSAGDGILSTSTDDDSSSDRYVLDQGCLFVIRS